ncbi:polyadenylate-binding protein 1-B-like [Leptopilina heterotoma]|uniref:polyadenylate-binding protein 1-B-like n=1 Tax=Leptopilina heterotoma TaxID=63436 RepID=UPI001CA9EAB7|nr:polyadenylate-binding protein 1-B-like [Leptopilina heterotoma]
MKFIIALVAVVLAAAAEASPINAWQGGWQDPWKNSGWQNNGWQNSGWQDPWKNSGWQDPWKSSGWQNQGWQNQGWQPKGHHEHYVHAIHVNQPPSIPALHPEPLHLKGHDHPNHIHYSAPHVHHPHLVGYEVQHHHEEPEIKNVKHGW